MTDYSNRETGEDQTQGITTPREDQNASETTVVADARAERENRAEEAEEVEAVREYGTETQLEPAEEAPADQSSLGGTGGDTVSF